MHVILRFGIVYGPRSNPGSAPESILAKVNHGDNVSVGSFNTARRFVFVEDLVAAISALVSDPEDLNGEIYNVSGPDLVSLGEIASISMEILEKNVEIEDGGLAPSIRNPDPLKFKARFGFTPSYGIRDGLVACLNARN
jgi:nucleoside-diphosphate-sugar epimerase